MSVPPPPNQWGSQPPTGGQPGGAPQWGPPQPWGPPPGPPPSRGGKGKWIFGGIALLAVIAVTVVITVLVVGKNSGGGESPTPTNGNGSDFASANDKGPSWHYHRRPDVCCLEPNCKRISSAESKAVNVEGSRSICQRCVDSRAASMYETVGKAMGDAADQAVESGEVDTASGYA